MIGNNIFWRQLGEYVNNYGLAMIAVTIMIVTESTVLIRLQSSILIGYALHYVVNIYPAKRTQIMDTLNSEEPSEDRKDEPTELVSDTLRTEKLKQVGIVQGVINNDLTMGKLHGKLATAQLRARTKKMQEDMTLEQRNDEGRTKAEQLESIIKLMMQNKEKFGITSEDDINEQLKMYNF
ncbi:unnamed protein product [Angiostrongylus costaricensis]|uniref:Protein trafficking protein n=1 Tax=Angiostrongylus costaricensis TaxID=334426 RepID=A0A0R3PNG0_ANGCS|nr:unnamed protein product [Angiostrongylus costaricensis]